MRLTIIAAALTLSACQWVPGTKDHLIDQAKKSVAAELRDPASAQFRAVKAVRQEDGSIAVCGEVNGRNAFGGYAGYSQFYVHRGQVSLAPDTQNAVTVEDASAAYGWIADYGKACVLGDPA